MESTLDLILIALYIALGAVVAGSIGLVIVLNLRFKNRDLQQNLGDLMKWRDDTVRELRSYEQDAVNVFVAQNVYVTSHALNALVKGITRKGSGVPVKQAYAFLWSLIPYIGHSRKYAEASSRLLLSFERKHEDIKLQITVKMDSETAFASIGWEGLNFPINIILKRV